MLVKRQTEQTCLVVEYGSHTPDRDTWDQGKDTEEVMIRGIYVHNIEVEIAIPCYRDTASLHNIM